MPVFCVSVCALIHVVFGSPSGEMKDTDVNHVSSPRGSASRIAFIQAGWHADIVGRARESFLAALAEGGFDPALVDVFDVPGAFEIPLRAKRLALGGRYRAIVAAGLVVDGGIYRHDFVATAVINGLMQVQLETDVPVLSVVLTPHHYHDHAVHQTFFAEHFVVKGREAAAAALAVIEPAHAAA